MSSVPNRGFEALKRDDREENGSGVGQTLGWPAARPKDGMITRRDRCPLYKEEKKVPEFIELTGYSCTLYGNRMENVRNPSLPVDGPIQPA